MTRTTALRRLAKPGLALALLAGLTSLSHSTVARAATTYTVTTNGDGTVTPCTGTTCTNLRDAVSAANTAGGTNSIVFAASANGTITLTNGVIDLTGSGTDILTITGNGEASTIISGGGVTQIFLDSSGGAVTLADLSLKDGDGVLGGDIKTLGALTLNSVSASGGVLPTTTTGGVIWAQSPVSACATTTLDNSTVSGTASGPGGAIFGEVVSVNSSTVTGTSTAGEGGAIRADCSADVESSTVTGSAGSTADGGAIFVTPSVLIGTAPGLTIANSTIRGGTANSGGAVYFEAVDAPAPCSGPAWSITASTLTGGNASGAGGEGGALYNSAGSLTLTRSTVTGNPATTSGGGIYNACSLTSVGSTIAGNTAPAGSGIEQGAGSADVATLTATILDDTAATECAGGTFVSGTYNLDDGTTCGLTGTGDQQNKSATLGPLHSNGGPTQTMGLLPGSPAIAQIPLPDGTVCTTTDQRGVNRQNASADDNKCDVGALEVVSTTTKVSGPSTAVAGTPVTLTATITEAVVLAGAKPTGTVTFTDNGSTLGTAESDPGTATLTTSSLSAGAHSVSAHYPGSGIFDPSGGGTAAITVLVPVPVVGASLSAPSTYGGGALFLGGILAVAASLRPRRSRRRVT